MMIRPWQIWIMFLLGVTVVFGAVGWLTARTITLNRGEAEARRQASLEEKLRLALWRMDSAIWPLLIEESAQPLVGYGQHTPSGAVVADTGLPSSRETLVLQSSSRVLLYFLIDSTGQLSFPGRSRAQEGAPESAAVSEMAERLQHRLVSHRKSADANGLLAQLPDPMVRAPLSSVEVPQANWPANLNQQAAQRELSNYEYQVRAQLALQNNAAVQTNGFFQQQQVQQFAVPQPATTEQLSDEIFASPFRDDDVDRVTETSEAPPWQVGALTPVWLDRDLVLARKVIGADGMSVQGCVLDWPRIERDLLQIVEDLLPAAELQPVVTDLQDPAHRLAILPVRLVPRELAASDSATLAPIQFSLVVAWVALLAAALAGAAILQGILGLSERRAAFVSAVTHELRTPLTTFRLYAEMLAEGMVPDESRTRYLSTLQGEADRLMHLVENVLAYARLERNPSGIAVETIGVGELLDAVQERLAERATRCDLQLVIDAEPEAVEQFALLSLQAVEQILLNLVDNACKYAAQTTDRRLHLEIDVVADHVLLGVRDHGPGIARAAQRRLFRPFHKSAHDAAQTAPGVGLGLAFSRRLARSMRGELRLDRSLTPGARFVLSVPRSRMP